MPDESFCLLMWDIDMKFNKLYIGKIMFVVRQQKIENKCHSFKKNYMTDIVYLWIKNYCFKLLFKKQIRTHHYIFR
jgi:hypothetical protein